MIEAVENHMPQVVVIDEIGTEAEALAARTIAERGVTHGQVSLIPVMIETDAHSHRVEGDGRHLDGHAPDLHVHIHPRN